MNNSAAVKIRGAVAQDLPALLRMMRSLAERPPAIPFDEGELRAALEAFLAHAELGQAWLLWLGEKAAGYVILTLGYSFEFRGATLLLMNYTLSRNSGAWGWAGARWILWRKKHARWA